MEKKVLTQEELTTLKDLQTRQDQLIVSLGSLEYRKTLLENQQQILKSQIEELERFSLEVGTKLTEKYGNGKIDFETGEITEE